MLRPDRGIHDGEPMMANMLGGAVGNYHPFRFGPLACRFGSRICSVPDHVTDVVRIFSFSSTLPTLPSVSGCSSRSLFGGVRCCFVRWASTLPGVSVSLSLLARLRAYGLATPG